MGTSRNHGMSSVADRDWPIDQAMTGTLAELARDRGLTVEIGALRLVLLRLLEEDGDVGRLAGYVARVAGVTVQAVKAQSVLHMQEENEHDNLDPYTAEMLARGGDIPSPSPGKEDS